LQIPLIYGIDAVHGHNNVVGATIFPHNIGLGATRDAALVEAVARATALEVAATGMDWDFAPCLAVPDDYRWGRTYEGFSEDTDLVSQLGGAAVRGYQSTDISNPQSVLACAKHFIGDGGTTFGTGLNNLIDRGNLAISEEELRKRHLPPFQKAIDEGVATFMAAYNTWNDVKCHANKFLLTDLLKDELGFKGFVVSDWAAIEEIPGDYKSDIITSINAGIDMVMVPGAVKFGNESFENFLKLGATDRRISAGFQPLKLLHSASNFGQKKAAHLEEGEPLSEQVTAETVLTLAIVLCAFKSDGRLPFLESTQWTQSILPSTIPTRFEQSLRKPFFHTL